MNQMKIQPFWPLSLFLGYQLLERFLLATVAMLMLNTEKLFLLSFLLPWKKINLMPAYFRETFRLKQYFRKHLMTYCKSEQTCSVGRNGFRPVYLLSWTLCIFGFLYGAFGWKSREDWAREISVKGPDKESEMGSKTSIVLFFGGNLWNWRTLPTWQ